MFNILGPEPWITQAVARARVAELVAQDGHHITEHDASRIVGLLATHEGHDGERLVFACNELEFWRAVGEVLYPQRNELEDELRDRDEKITELEGKVRELALAVATTAELAEVLIETVRS